MQEWWRGAVLYQVYPRSFRDSDQDGIGDLPGLLAGLDHIADLGVDGIWISPFFTSPMRDFGYDVADYCNVDPLFGTIEDFDRVLLRAHQLGLKVIIDQVYAHSSDQHPWFRESRSSASNPYRDFYVWADARPDGSVPNNWQSVFGGASWSWDHSRQQYYLHNFLPEQPQLNLHNPQVQKSLMTIAEFWLARGVDGFRLDVINLATHGQALSDNPPADRRGHPLATRPFFFQHHIHDFNQPDNIGFLNRLRGVLDAFPDRMSVGELFDDAIGLGDLEAATHLQSEYTSGVDRLHTAYSFYFLVAKALTPALVAKAIEAWQDRPGWPAWSLGNHDVMRFPTRLFGDHPPQIAIEAALTLLLCLRGTIFLYQGEELGLPHGEMAPDRILDPEHKRNNTPGSGRDGARTPLPWKQNGAMAGFTQAEDAWLPLDPRHQALAIDAQQADKNSVLHFLRALLAMRRQHRALRAGQARVTLCDSQCLVFERFLDPDTASDHRLICVFNLSDQRIIRELPFGNTKALCAKAYRMEAMANGHRLHLEPYGFAILQRLPD